MSVIGNLLEREQEPLIPSGARVATEEDPWIRVLPYRVLARIIDLALAVAVAGGMLAVTGLLQFAGLLIAPLDFLKDFAQDARIPLVVAAAVVFHIYNGIWRVAARGASWGKSGLGLVVIDPDGRPLSFGKAIVREVVTVVLTAIVQFVVALIRPDRRSLADLAAGSYVHSRDASPPPGVARDVRAYRAVGQIVAVIAVLGLVQWLIDNLLTNLDETGISTDFDFLENPTNFQIPFDAGFDPRSSVRAMVWVGVKNTLLSASVGIVIATVLGTLIGIARLSSNWLVAKLATIYVEVLRNIPPLVVIIFFGAAVFTNGPFPILSGTSEPTTWSPFGDDNVLILSNTVWGIPSFASDGNVGAFWALVVVAILVAIAVWIWRTSVNTRTGAPHHRLMYTLGAFLVIVVLAFVLLGGPYQWSWPSVSENGRRIENGFVMNFGYISVTVALGLYTASHIAEIIRGSILAVPKGQTEASNALALSGFQRYRYVVLPQAARIAIPPTINQFLNLTKNTSLGIAVAYAEITALTKTSIGNGRPAVQSLVILMVIYLTFSIGISLVLNVVNRRAQLVER